MYQANVSHLHKPAGGTVVTNRTGRPPLPGTKPPLSLRQPPSTPTNMQNLDATFVNKFMQVVNEKPPQNGTSSSEKFKSEYAFQPQSPQASHLWKQAERSLTDGPACTESLQNGTKPTPPWLSKTAKSSSPDAVPSWVKKAEETKQTWGGAVEAPKPTWTAKSLERPKAVWSPKPAGNEVNNVNPPINQCNGTKVGVAQIGRQVSKEDTKVPVFSSPNRIGGVDWRNKYDESERKRKELLEENQRAALEKSNLERRANKLENDLQKLQEEHDRKSQQLDKLSQVSQKVYHDYDKLNNKYEVETTAMHRALQVASKWYVQNKKLRRASVAKSPNETSPLDETDGEDNELEDLRKTVQDLSTQVGQLQSELNTAKLQESEVQDQQVTLQQQLDEERQKTHKLTKEVKELKLMREKFESVSVMVQGEVESLRQQRDNALEQVKRFQGETHEANKERNVLKHQSTLLMGDMSPDERMFNVLLEVEDLKRQLEESENKHEREMQELQERLEEKQSDAYVELLEGKVRLLEGELQMALDRVEQAEASLQQLKSEGKLAGPSQSTSGAPCPPPPPPPPPLPPMLGGTNPPIKRPSHVKRPTEGDSLEDMARLLGIERSPKPPSPQVVAIDNIINEIKGGKFTLKATEKVAVKKEEQPAAVQEMLSIIGTLKRRPRSKGSINV